MVIVELTCGHTAELSAAYARDGIGDEERCPTCPGTPWNLVVRKWRSQWHSSCVSPKCRFGKSHGFAKAYAERAAALHEARTGHVGMTRLAFYNDCPTALRPSKRENITTGMATLFDAENPPF